MSATPVTLASLASHPLWVGWKKEATGRQTDKTAVQPQDGTKGQGRQPVHLDDARPRRTSG